MSASPLARADEPSRSSRVSRHVVELNVTGGQDDVAVLDATIRELLGRLQLVVTHGPALDRSTVLARVSVAMTSVGGARVEVIDARDGHVVMQRTVPKEGSSSITREAIAHAVQSAVEAQLLDAEAPAAEPAPAPAAPESPSPAPAPAPTPATMPLEQAPPEALKDVVVEKPASRSTMALDVATFGGFGPIARGSGIVPRVGAGVTLASRAGVRPALTLIGAYALPFDNDAAFVSSRTSFVSIRALPSLQLVGFSQVAIDLSAGGGFDVLSVQPTSTVLPASALGQDTSRIDPLLTSMLTARIGIVPGVVLLASAGIDVDLSTRAYIVDNAGTRTEVLSPWRVRPAIVLGFAFTALGPAAFAAPDEPKQGGRS
ncbi:hypothetical protein [Labilithrix luteola]|uniref:hypothetical protein n=1 Tax=Labilithrix luteola TaxID=1391654 RepID=UPI001969F949|nr:hypothetical protein [Labilithrix luteola]